MTDLRVAPPGERPQSANPLKRRVRHVWSAESS